jgi:putative transposase
MTSHTTFPGHRALRTGRRSVPQQTYMLTFVTHRRLRHFAHRHVAHAVARLIHQSPLWRQHSLHAWVLMPDHAHLLCSLGVQESLPRLMGRIKAATATQANRVLQRSGMFWARGYHDHALRTDESLDRAIQYLVANPVRAGLVDHPWQWPFWNCRWMDSMEDILSLPDSWG